MKNWILLAKKDTVLLYTKAIWRQCVCLFIITKLQNDSTDSDEMLREDFTRSENRSSPKKNPDPKIPFARKPPNTEDVLWSHLTKYFLNNVWTFYFDVFAHLEISIKNAFPLVILPNLHFNILDSEKKKRIQISIKML